MTVTESVPSWTSILLAGISLLMLHRWSILSTPIRKHLMELQMLEQKTELLKNQLKQTPHSWSEVPAIIAYTLNHISVAASRMCAKPCFNPFFKA